MGYAQVYATVGELIKDLGLSGDEEGLLDRIREASNLVQNKLGEFVPVTGTRSFAARFAGKLEIDPCVSVTAITNGGTLLTAADYTPYPLNRHWLNGPYSFLYSDTVSWSQTAVLVEGRWGKYEAQAQPDVSTVSQASSTQRSLTVSNGSQVAPGMVLLIENEQELVTSGNGGMGGPDPTMATSLLNATIGSEDEEITVDNGAAFCRGEVVRVGTGDVYIRRIVSNVLVCARGWNGTTKAPHSDNTPLYVYRTFGVERGVNGTSAALHAGATLLRLTAPEDVNWLTRQVAGLMRMKAKAGFASKSGSAELGETFYYSEFPTAFKRLAEFYRIGV